MDEPTKRDEKSRQEEVDEDDIDDEDFDTEFEQAELELAAERKRLQVALTTRERSRTQSLRRQAFTAMQAEVHALREQVAQSGDQEHISTTNDEPARRELDFGTPYVRNFPDLYSRATDVPARKSNRRQTLAVLDQDENAEAELMIRVPMPNKFDGSGLCSSSDDPTDSVQVRLAQALDAIVDYIEFVCDFKGVKLSARQFVKLACQFLTGTAAGVYKNLQLIASQEAARRGDEKPILVLWPDVRRALEVRFGRPQPGHQLIMRMLKLKQKAQESVESYTVRYDSLHMELTRQELASRDLSVALYMEGLIPVIKEKVEEVVNSVDYFEREKISTYEARKAITSLQLLATARETHLSSNSRQQQQSNGTTRSVQPTPNQHSNPSRGNKQAQPRLASVPDSLYADRLAAGLCGKCNSASHAARDCTNSRNTLPVPAARRSGVRANMMSTEDERHDERCIEPKKV